MRLGTLGLLCAAVVTGGLGGFAAAQPAKANPAAVHACANAAFSARNP